MYEPGHKHLAEPGRGEFGGDPEVRGADREHVHDGVRAGGARELRLVRFGRHHQPSCFPARRLQ